MTTRQRNLDREQVRCGNCLYGEMTDHVDGKCLWGPTQFRAVTCGLGECETVIFQMWHFIYATPEGRWFHGSCTRRADVVDVVQCFIDTEHPLYNPRR